jgi:hypothetical protein
VSGELAAGWPAPAAAGHLWAGHRSPIYQGFGVQLCWLLDGLLLLLLATFGLDAVLQYIKALVSQLCWLLLLLLVTLGWTPFSNISWLWRA